MGYVGAPRGLPHCDEVGHKLVEHRTMDGFVSQHCLRTVHAETNAILQAARFGISVEGGVMYCTMFPCPACAMNIINVGICQVISEYDYQLSVTSKELFSAADISYRIGKPNAMLY